MDKAFEIDKKLEEVKVLIKSAKKNKLYKEHFEMLEALIYDADFLVFNYHLSPNELRKEFKNHEKGRRYVKQLQEELSEEKEL